jgi:hypothetical protein
MVDSGKFKLSKKKFDLYDKQIMSTLSTKLD